MKRVVIESPYSPSNGRTVEQNEAYARSALADSLSRGEAPIASHLLYTQPGVLDDTDPAERRLGMEAGFLWGSQALLVVVYSDYGTTEGMRIGIETYANLGIPVEYRTLFGG